jgi:hypothetical protein
MTATSHPSGSRAAAATAFLAVTALVLALAPTSTAAAQDPPYDRGIDRACPERTRAAEPFADVASGAIHGEAVACVWAYGIAQGRFVDGQNVYAPRETVTRQQMASFIAGTLASLPADVYELPETDGAPRFEDADAISRAHVRNVDRLHAAGIVSGYADGTFRPTVPLDRAQMASFIAQSIEAVTGQALGRAAVFGDVSGAHRANIEKIASIGVTAGRGPGTYAPQEPISREQMASFLARMLDHLVAEGLLQPLSYAAGTAAALGLIDVDLGVQDGADRVVFTVAGDDRLVGWRVQYVDEARAQGSGQLVSVQGDAVLQVILTGMALPPDLPQSIQDQLWDADSVTFSGAGIVEVVDLGVYEGQQQLFVGTSGRLPFTVERLQDPQRVYIDVRHP